MVSIYWNKNIWKFDYKGHFKSTCCKLSTVTLSHLHTENLKKFNFI